MIRSGNGCQVRLNQVTHIDLLHCTAGNFHLNVKLMWAPAGVNIQASSPGAIFNQAADEQQPSHDYADHLPAWGFAE